MGLQAQEVYGVSATYLHRYWEAAIDGPVKNALLDPQIRFLNGG